MDEQAWPAWCSAMVHRGVGLIMVDGRLPNIDQLLSSARQVIGRRLVGVVEPVNPEIHSDVIHLRSADQAGLWPTSLVGCEVSGADEAQGAEEAGCAYVVTDAHNLEVTADMAQWVKDHPQMVWFLAGCENSSDLEEAIRQGVRRVWINDDDGMEIAACSALLRDAWRADPAMALVRGQRGVR